MPVIREPPAPQTIATGLAFPEGPVYLGPDDILLTEIRGQRVARARDGTVSEVAPTGGGTNGLARARDGTLYVANNGGLNVGPEGYWFASDPITGRIQTIDAGGVLADLVTEFPRPLPRPNDLCFGPDGRLYFTDPHNWEDLANLGPGRIWRCERDGSDLTVLAEGLRFPNGIAFGPGGTELFVAQSIAQNVLAHPWSETGIGEPREHCTLPAGFPDGMCFAADGTLFVCGSMGHVIGVFAPDGSPREQVTPGDGTEPTNCCIGAGRLYVTLSGSGALVAYDLDVEALPLYD